MVLPRLTSGEPDFNFNFVKARNPENSYLTRLRLPSESMTRVTQPSHPVYLMPNLRLAPSKGREADRRTEF